MSIVQQFNDGLCNAMEGKSQEEQDRMMKMLADAFKANGSQECSLKALIGKKEPQAKCIKCNKMFLIEEIRIANGCPDCKQTEDFEVLGE
jgi:Zn finger protein HypA/HybF involved in hydrogenase expression